MVEACFAFADYLEGQHAFAENARRPSPATDRRGNAGETRLSPAATMACDAAEHDPEVF